MPALYAEKPENFNRRTNQGFFRPPVDFAPRFGLSKHRLPWNSPKNWRRRKMKEQSRMIIQSMITLASAALGLVAALAWNDAIKQTMKQLLGENEGLAALYTYAILATVIAIIVLLMLSRMAAKIGGEAAISREAEG
jgi:uncharacterized membrane protein YidH (DUF202 family)